MHRIGANIEEKFCDVMKNKLDLNKEYTSNELIEFFRNDPDLTFEFLVYWLMGGADWVGNQEKENYVLQKLNQFIKDHPNPKGDDLHIESITNETCKQKFYHCYAVNETETRINYYKEHLLNAFIT